MKVFELILNLNDFPDDLEVIIVNHGDSTGLYDIGDVEQDKDEDNKDVVKIHTS